MNIYEQDGRKYIYLTNDELKELGWDEYRLLELSKEDRLIGPSNVAASKFRYGKENLGKT
tara:strand:+ start:1969 stop:2148 length:180 start_codon:yes stop_codon:yes gene_type:complete